MSENKFVELLRDFENKLLDAAFSRARDVLAYADTSSEMEEVRVACRILIEHVHELECTISGELPDHYAVDCSNDRITGKCYAVVADALPNGAIVKTWDEAEALTKSQPGGCTKGCSSPEGARAWIDKALEKPAPVLFPNNVPDDDDPPPW